MTPTDPAPLLSPPFSPPASLELPRGRSLRLDGGPRIPLIMGILNLTPDSFSDGGLWHQPEAAVERGLALLAEGADLLDLGAESTRPGGGVYGAGAAEVSVEEESARLLPVLAGLRRRTDAPLSVDTRRGEVARRALAAGADLINDVSAGADPALLTAVAEAGCPLILMHSRGELSTMQRGIHFDDLLGEVTAELEAAIGRAEGAEIARRQLVVDPGIGFGKTWRQNLELIARLEEIGGVLGLPVLLGASRKSFLARTLEEAGVPGADGPPAARLGASLAAAAWGLAGEAAILRVHDVAETVQFIAVHRALARHGKTAGEGAWTV